MPYRNSRCLFCLGYSSQPSTKYYFSHHTLFHFISLYRPATWAGNCAGSPVSMSLVYTIQYVVYTLYRKPDLCIPGNETAQPRSQFLHSCICELFIHVYPQDWSCFGNNGRAISFLEYINRNQTFIWILTGPSFAV